MNEKLRKAKLPLVFCFVGILIGTIIGAYALTPPSHSSTMTSGIFPSAANYTIYLDGSTYYAKDMWGENKFSGSNRTVVTQDAINTLTSGTVFLKEFRKPPLTIPANVRVIEQYNGEIREYTIYGLEFETFGVRTGYSAGGGLCYRDSNDYYYVVRVGPVSNQYFSWWSYQLFGFGTYEWKAYVRNLNASQNHIFGFEWHHGYAQEGLIAFRVDGDPTPYYRAVVNWLSLSQSVDTSGGWTSSKTFKIEWTSTYVKIYINGVLQGEVTGAYVPQKPMMFFLEAFTDASAPSGDFDVHTRDFVEIVP